MKQRALKYIRNITISFVVLLILLLIAGAAYTWYMGQNSVDPVDTAAIPVQSELVPVIKHPQPAADAKVGASIQMLTTPVAPGSNASMTVKTNPGAKCLIAAIYNKVRSTDSGLVSKIADEYGIVDWTWTVESSVPLGKWPVTVTCSNEKNSGVVTGDLVVAKQVD